MGTVPIEGSHWDVSSAPRSFSLCGKLGFSTWALLGFFATQVGHRHPGGNLVSSRTQRVDVLKGETCEI